MLQERSWCWSGRDKQKMEEKQLNARNKSIVSLLYIVGIIKVRALTYS
jgi:hypothetical protein